MNPIKTAFQSAEPSFPGATFHFAKKETELEMICFQNLEKFKIGK